MAQLFTIERIEGNSNIGVPVFSRFGQMQNYNYIVMSPQKRPKGPKVGEPPLLDAENQRFKITGNKVASSAGKGDDLLAKAGSTENSAARKNISPRNNALDAYKTNVIDKQPLTEERQEFVLNMMSELDKKLDQLKVKQMVQAGHKPPPAQNSDNLASPKVAPTSNEKKVFAPKRAKNSKQASANFVSMSKDAYYKQHMTNPDKIPPSNAYNPKFSAIDGKVMTPLYGTQSTWDNHLKHKSQKIKNTTFKQKTHMCARIDRSLARHNAGRFTRQQHDDDVSDVLRMETIDASSVQASIEPKNNSRSVDNVKVSGLQTALNFSKQPLDTELTRRTMAESTRNTAHRFKPVPNILVNNYNNTSKIEQLKNYENLSAKKSFNFSFKNHRISNTPYHLVESKQHKELIKNETSLFQAPFTHNGTIDFQRTQGRPPFVDERNPPNQRRFELPDTYDKSTWLTKVRRSKHVTGFNRQKSRDNTLIQKGGNSLLKLADKVDGVYDLTQKEKNLMKRLDNSVPCLQRTTQRVNYNSIYPREVAPDHLDNLKVAEVQKKLISKKKDAFVDLKKQTKRDLTKMLCNTDFYKNVERDNAHDTGNLAIPTEKEEKSKTGQGGDIKINIDALERTISPRSLSSFSARSLPSSEGLKSPPELSEIQIFNNTQQNKGESKMKESPSHFNQSSMRNALPTAYKEFAKNQTSPSKKHSVSNSRSYGASSQKLRQQRDGTVGTPITLSGFLSPISKQPSSAQSKQQSSIQTYQQDLPGKTSFGSFVDSSWLQNANAQVEATVDLINEKKVREAEQKLQLLNQEINQARITDFLAIRQSQRDYLSTVRQFQLTQACQIGIIVKYNLACCLQQMGNSQECIRILQEATSFLRLFNKYNQEKSNQKTSKSLFKTGKRQSNGHDSDEPEGHSEYNEYMNNNEISEDYVTQTKKQKATLFVSDLQELRYLCKFHLQLCAILSQQGHHLEANQNGQTAARIATEIMLKTRSFVEESISDIMQKDMKDKPEEKPEEEPQSESCAYKPLHNQTVNHTRAHSRNSAQPQRRHLSKVSSWSSLYSHEKDRRSISIRRSGQSKSMAKCHSQAKIRGKDNPSNQEKSLERMYTFNLSSLAKNSPSKTNLSPTNLTNQKDLTNKKQTPSVKSKPLKHNRKASVKSSQVPQTFQVLERTNIQEKLLFQVQPLLNQFEKVTSEFESAKLVFGQPPTADVWGHQAVDKMFKSDKEIAQLKENKRYKINVRNSLGVRDHNNWIYNLNIGNVMNLTAMNSDELQPQSDTMNEVSKDTLLEKIILFVVAFFCVGTEIRFKASKFDDNKSIDEYISIWLSELWHSKSVEAASLFLPEECPLVEHIAKSYKKHYLSENSLLSKAVKPDAPKIPIAFSETTEPERVTSKIKRRGKRDADSQGSSQVTQFEAQKSQNISSFNKKDTPKKKSLAQGQQPRILQQKSKSKPAQKIKIEPEDGETLRLDFQGSGGFQDSTTVMSQMTQSKTTNNLRDALKDNNSSQATGNLTNPQFSISNPATVTMFSNSQTPTPSQTQTQINQSSLGGKSSSDSSTINVLKRNFTIKDLAFSKNKIKLSGTNLKPPQSPLSVARNISASGDDKIERMIKQRAPSDALTEVGDKKIKVKSRNKDAVISLTQTSNNSQGSSQRFIPDTVTQSPRVLRQILVSSASTAQIGKKKPKLITTKSSMRQSPKQSKTGSSKMIQQMVKTAQNFNTNPLSSTQQKPETRIQSSQLPTKKYTQPSTKHLKQLLGSTQPSLLSQQKKVQYVDLGSLGVTPKPISSQKCKKVAPKTVRPGKPATSVGTVQVMKTKKMPSTLTSSASLKGLAYKSGTLPKQVKSPTYSGSIKNLGPSVKVHPAHTTRGSRKDLKLGSTQVNLHEQLGPMEMISPKNVKRPTTSENLQTLFYPSAQTVATKQLMKTGASQYQSTACLNKVVKLKKSPSSAAVQSKMLKKIKSTDELRLQSTDALRKSSANCKKTKQEATKFLIARTQTPQM